MPTESSTCFGLVVISRVGRQVSGEEEGVGVVLFTVKMYLACDLMLKKKLPPLMIEMVVILNHLVVIHLWRSQTLTNFVTPLPSPPSAKTNNRSSVYKIIYRHVTNFWNLPPSFYYVDVINVWFSTRLMWYEIFFCFRKNYHRVVWTKQSYHENIASRHF